jgi:hypothetical protein
MTAAAHETSQYQITHSTCIFQFVTIQWQGVLIIYCVNFILQLHFVLTSVIQQTYCVLFYIILHQNTLCCVKTSNIVLDLVTTIIVYFYNDFIPRFF